MYYPDRHPNPTAGVKITTNVADAVVPHCKPSAKNDATNIRVGTPSRHIGLGSSMSSEGNPQYAWT